MEFLTNVASLKLWREERAGRPCVLVPTMGALHEGHLSLVERARQHAGPQGSVIVSIFVNPTQFGPNEDFDAYPRQMEADREKCERAGASAVFAPAVSGMYAPDRSVNIQEDSLSTYLCGATRPGHFGGVCTVVTKLFNLVRPDAAVFGEKDFQQLAIIRRLARDLDFAVEIVGSPTVREPDGLAMSSRNENLTAEGRSQAPVIYRALQLGRAALEDGERDAAKVRQLVLDTIQSQPLARVDYVEVVHPETLQPLDVIASQALIAAAVFFGKPRLIDNTYWREA